MAATCGPGSSLGGSLAPHAALGVRGSSAPAGWKVPCPSPPSSAVGGACCVWWRGWEEGGSGGKGVWRGRERVGERVPVAAVRRPPLVAARRPADRRSRAPPPPPPRRPSSEAPSSSPSRTHARPPARLASRRVVRGRKPAPRPARPRPWPRSRGSRVPGGDPRDAAVSSAVARPPPARGRAAPCRGPVPGCRVGAGRLRRRVLGPVPATSAGDGSGCVRCPSRPRPVPLPPVVPLRRGGAGVPSAAALSLPSPLPSPGPSLDGASGGRSVGPARCRPSASAERPVPARRPRSPLRDATSDQTWRPAEFKHISQRRKRN